MGFKTSVAKPGRRMLLVASIPLGGVDLVPGLNLDNVDLVVLHARDLVGGDSLKRVAGKLQDVPWGVWIEQADEGWIREFESVGGDFLSFNSPSAAATLLQEEKLGKVLKVEPSLDRNLLVAIHDLPIDAVLLDIKADKDLAISDVMACRWLINVTGKPQLVAPQTELSEAEIQSLWQVGVMGLVIEIAGQGWQDLVARQSQAIWKLPARQRKRKEGAVLLPSLGQDAGDIDED